MRSWSCRRGPNRIGGHASTRPTIPKARKTSLRTSLMFLSRSSGCRSCAATSRRSILPRYLLPPLTPPTPLPSPPSHSFSFSPLSFSLTSYLFFFLYFKFFSFFLFFFFLFFFLYF